MYFGFKYLIVKPKFQQTPKSNPKRGKEGSKTLMTMAKKLRSTDGAFNTKSCYNIFSGDFDVQIRNGYQPNFEVFLHLFSCGRFDHWSVLSSNILSILHTGILALQQVELLTENGAVLSRYWRSKIWLSKSYMAAGCQQKNTTLRHFL